MKKIGSMLGTAAVFTLLLAPLSKATVIYSETFSTASSDLLTDYGFTRSGWNAGGSYTAAGEKAVISGTSTAEGKLTHTLATPYAYDWSQPLTLSADLSTTTTTANGTYGIWLANLGYSRNVGGNLTNGRGGSNTGGNQITGWLENMTAINDDAGFSMSITVRQNTGNTGNFDVLFQVNGLDQGIGWYTGLSKATYGLSGNISTLGIRGDGFSNGTHTLDNLQLAVIPEPGSLTLLGLLGGALFLRRKLRQHR